MHYQLHNKKNETGRGQTVASVQMIQQRTKVQGTHARNRQRNRTCGREQDTGEVDQGGTDDHSGGKRTKTQKERTTECNRKCRRQTPIYKSGSRQGDMRSHQGNGLRNNQCADENFINTSLRYQLGFQLFDVLWTPHVLCDPAIKCPSFHMISSFVVSRWLRVLHTLSFTAHAQCLNASVHADWL